MTRIATLIAAASLLAACGKSEDKKTDEPATKPAETQTADKPAEPAKPEPAKPTEPAPAEKDIVDIATEAGTFKTLLAAVKAAGLVETLKGDGPFTVFAPSDDAFAKLPEGTVEALLEDKEKLTKILTYHVVPGKVMAADVAKIEKAKTVAGLELPIDTSDGVKVGKAKVVKADIAASNGVIHVIDTVLIPE